ncbi:MAG: beta-propeller fold lactonase family protein [Acidobacteria bacterium]|nr:beta-propeller fold lactonase family protein [Acidobacteriota bacterium]
MSKAGGKCALGLAVALAVILATSGGCRRPRGTAYEGYAFVAAAGSSSLAVVDLASFSVVRQIRLHSRPAQVLSDPDRGALYVMSEGGPAGLSVIDAARLELKRSMWLAEKPVRVRLAAGSQRLYALDGKAQLLKALDLEKMAVGGEVRLGAPPVDFDLSPDARWAAVSLASGEVAVVNLAEWKTTAAIRVGGEPGAVAVRFDGRQAFVANRKDRNIAVIDLAAGRLLAYLPLDARPEALRFKPDGGELFVSGGDANVVVIVSAYRDEIDQPMLAGAEPRDIAITRDNRLLFVANSAANTVTVMNIDERRVLASVPVGEEPHRVALTPDDQYALVLNRKSGDVAVIRTAALPRGRDWLQPLFTMIPVGSEPVDLAIQPR